MVTISVRLIWLPKVLSAFSFNPAPKALEIMLLPPIPMAMPKAAIKKDTGRTTLMAAMAIEPIQLPTKIVSTRMLRLITRMPMEAGTACFTNSRPMGSVPNCSEETLDMVAKLRL